MAAARRVDRARHVTLQHALGALDPRIGHRRARRQTGYKPVFEDRLFHTILPLLSYGTLLGAAVVLVRQPEGSLFAIAGASLLLLFIGIHNAWDTVTYIALVRPQAPPEEPKSGSSGTG